MSLGALPCRPANPDPQAGALKTSSRSRPARSRGGSRRSPVRRAATRAPSARRYPRLEARTADRGSPPADPSRPWPRSPPRRARADADISTCQYSAARPERTCCVNSALTVRHQQRTSRHHRHPTRTPRRADTPAHHDRDARRLETAQSRITFVRPPGTLPAMRIARYVSCPEQTPRAGGRTERPTPGGNAADRRRRATDAQCGYWWSARACGWRCERREPSPRRRLSSASGTHRRWLAGGAARSPGPCRTVGFLAGGPTCGTAAGAPTEPGWAASRKDFWVRQLFGRRVHTTVSWVVTAPSARVTATVTGNSGRAPASSSARIEDAVRSRRAVARSGPRASFR